MPQEKTHEFSIVGIGPEKPDEIKAILSSMSDEYKKWLSGGMAEWLGSNMNDFLVAYAKATVALSDVKFQILEKPEGFDANYEFLTSLAFHYMQTIKPEREDGLKPEERKELFGALLNEGIALCVKKSENKMMGIGEGPGLSTITELLDDLGGQSLARNKDALRIAIDRHKKAVDAGTDVNGFLETFSMLATPILGQLEYKGTDRAKVNAQLEELADKLIQFGAAVSRLDANPSYEAFWGLRVACRDEYLYGTPEDMMKNVDNYASLAKRIYDTGEKDMLRFFTDLMWSGVPATDEGRLDKLAKVHDYFGIARFSKLMQNDRDFSVMDELIRNWEDRGYNSEKPLCIITLPREGGSGVMGAMGKDVFDDMDRMIAELSKKYKVLVFDVASDENVERALSMAEEREGRKADVYFHGAHSSQKTSNYSRSFWSEPMGEKDRLQPEGAGGKKIASRKGNYFTSDTFYPKSDEEKGLDIDSPRDIRIIEKSATHIAPDGIIIIYGCEGGMGGDAARNLVNTWARAAPGRIVTGPAESISGGTVNYGKDGRIDRAKPVSFFINLDNWTPDNPATRSVQEYIRKEEGTKKLSR